MFHSFSIPKQGRGTYPSFRIFSVLLYGTLGQIFIIAKGTQSLSFLLPAHKYDTPLKQKS